MSLLIQSVFRAAERGWTHSHFFLCCTRKHQGQQLQPCVFYLGNNTGLQFPAPFGTCELFSGYSNSCCCVTKANASIGAAASLQPSYSVPLHRPLNVRHMHKEHRAEVLHKTPSCNTEAAKLSMSSRSQQVCSPAASFHMCTMRIMSPMPYCASSTVSCLMDRPLRYHSS